MARRFSWLWSGQSQKAVEQGLRVELSGDVFEPVAGRVARLRSGEDFAQDSRLLAELMFGRDFAGAPAGWWSAPLVGVLTDDLAGREGFSSVQLGPGWSLGVLEQLSASFLIFEQRAFESGVWAGALEPGGEHLLDELLLLVKVAQRKHMTPLLIENADTISWLMMPGWVRLRSVVPVLTADEESFGLPLSEVMGLLLDYVSSGEDDAA